MGLKKYRNKEGMKTQKAIMLQTSLGKERLGDYSTSVVKIKSGNRRRVVSQSFFTKACLQQDSLCVFLPSLFLYFFQAHPYLNLNFYRNVFTLISNFKIAYLSKTCWLMNKRESWVV